MNMKTVVAIFGAVFVAALLYLIATGFVANLTGNVIGEGILSKDYQEEFSGDVSESEIFDLGKLVSVDEIEVSWTDDRNTCWGQVKVSKDGETWFVKESWKDVPSPAVFTLKALGEIRYIMFEESSCSSYTISSMNVVGTYSEQQSE
ncbi:hypothetical protein CMI41_04225 [Candidatus Pacearchaeota archaeon]|jgi:hypothetical protein|nr:hypothetical protein [Candidatus Pacearchaeota archaeon]|tara:strand:- start:7199 stop:7639 length:441 start_codon:yes stop_codon:yes gene_type:complete